MEDVRVAAVCGSLRDDSYTRIALRRALDEAASMGAETDLIDLREFDLPVFDPDREEPPGAVELRRRIHEADAVLLGTPVYHASYSSALKNALDYCGFDEFDATTVGVLASAGGSFPVSALEHLRSVCRSVNAWVLPHQVAIPRARNQFDGGEFIEDSLEERVAMLGRRAVEYARIEPDPRTFESGQNVGADD